MKINGSYSSGRWLCFFCSVVYLTVSAFGLELRIEPYGKALAVIIVNDGEIPMRLNRIISQGTTDTSGNLKFIILNDEGASIPLRAKIDGPYLKQSDYFSLLPGSLTGRLFEWSLIVDEYSLKPGKYSIKARYWDGTEFSDRSRNPIDSNLLRVKVCEGADEIVVLSDKEDEASKK